MKKSYDLYLNMFLLFVFFLHNFIQHFLFDNVWIMKESDLKTLKRGYRVCLISILKSVFRVSYT